MGMRRGFTAFAIYGNWENDKAAAQKKKMPTDLWCPNLCGSLCPLCVSVAGLCYQLHHSGTENTEIAQRRLN